MNHTTTTHDTPDYTHMQLTLGDTFGGDFQRAEHHAALAEDKRLIGAQAHLATEDIHAEHRKRLWYGDNDPAAPECLRVRYDDNFWPHSELKTRVELAAHRYGLCCVEFSDRLLLVGRHEIGADAPNLAGFYAWQRKREQRQKDHVDVR